jgi:hypothetical protein
LGWLNTTSDRSSDESSRTESDAVVARDRHDGTALAVYTGRPRLFARLWAVPGVRVGAGRRRSPAADSVPGPLACWSRDDRRIAGPE